MNFVRKWFPQRFVFDLLMLRRKAWAILWRVHVGSALCAIGVHDWIMHYRASGRGIHLELSGQECVRCGKKRR